MKGILFKAWKADAIRTMGTDRDWQTRRALKPQPPERFPVPYCNGAICSFHAEKPGDYPAWEHYSIPKYKQGETVYVKERHRFRWADDSSDGKVEYSDGSTQDILDLGHKWRNSKWRSPMFMPEFAARTLLLITGVRVERTSGISWQDCIAEGVVQSPQWSNFDYEPAENLHPGILTPDEAEAELDRAWQEYVRQAYFALYDSINGAGAHERNWDWVYEFRRVDKEDKR